MSKVCCAATSRSLRSKDNQYLAAHLYVAEVDGGAVLLDLRALRYYAIDATSLAGLRTHILDWPHRAGTHSASESTEAPESSVNSFASRGFLSSTPQTDRFSSVSISPQFACHPVWSKRASLSETLLMLYRLVPAYLRALAYLRAKRLNALLIRLGAYAHTTNTSSPVPSQERLLSLVTTYAKLRVWLYTAKDRCLLDSLVLLAVLRKYNVPASLTVGVAPKPFSAHAWVQVQDCVLDDSVEHVREFTPILVA